MTNQIIIAGFVFLVLQWALLFFEQHQASLAAGTVGFACFISAAVVKIMEIIERGSDG